MRGSLLCLVFFLLLSASPAGAGPRLVELAVKPRVEVPPSGVLKVRELASISCDDEGLASSLGSVELRLDPAGGFVSLEELAEMVASSSRVPARLSLRGPSRVELVSGEVDGAGGFLLAEVGAAIARASGFDGRVELSVSPSFVDNIRGGRILPPGRIAPGSQTATLWVEKGGRRFSVPVSLRWFGRAVAVRSSVPRGKRIEASDLQVVEVAWRQDARWISDPASAVGAVARRPLAAGHLLTGGDLERSWAVRRGQTLLALARFGGVEVSVRAKSLDNGAVGDSIRLKNLLSGRIFVGKVLEGGVAIVEGSI